MSSLGRPVGAAHGWGGALPGLGGEPTHAHAEPQPPVHRAPSEGAGPGRRLRWAAPAPSAQPLPCADRCPPLETDPGKGPCRARRAQGPSPPHLSLTPSRPETAPHSPAVCGSRGAGSPAAARPSQARQAGAAAVPADRHPRPEPLPQPRLAGPAGREAGRGCGSRGCRPHCDPAQLRPWAGTVTGPILGGLAQLQDGGLRRTRGVGPLGRTATGPHSWKQAILRVRGLGVPLQRVARQGQCALLPAPGLGPHGETHVLLSLISGVPPLPPPGSPFLGHLVPPSRAWQSCQARHTPGL